MNHGNEPLQLEEEAPQVECFFSGHSREQNRSDWPLWMSLNKVWIILKKKKRRQWKGLSSRLFYLRKWKRCMLSSRCGEKGWQLSRHFPYLLSRFRNAFTSKPFLAASAPPFKLTDSYYFEITVCQSPHSRTPRKCHSIGLPRTQKSFTFVVISNITFTGPLNILNARPGSLRCWTETSVDKLRDRGQILELF